MIVISKLTNNNIELFYNPMFFEYFFSPDILDRKKNFMIIL